MTANSTSLARRSVVSDLPSPILNRVVRASEYTLDVSSLVIKDDAVNRGISTHAEKVNSHNNDEDVHQESDPSTNAPLLVETRTKVGPAHPKVRDAPEDPAEEGVEQTAHERQQVGEKGNDFGNDKSDNPGCGEDAGPRGPAHDGMRGLVSAAFEDAEEDEPRRHRRVEDAEEDQGRDHEGEGHFLVNVVAEGAKCRSCVVLCACVAVDFERNVGQSRLP